MSNDEIQYKNGKDLLNLDWFSFKRCGVNVNVFNNYPSHASKFHLAQIIVQAKIDSCGFYDETIAHFNYTLDII